MNYEINVHRIVRQKKGDNQYIERHSHDFFHFMYVLDGEGRIMVEDKGFNVKKYDLIIAPPKAEHEIYGKKDLITLDIKFTCGKDMENALRNAGFCINSISAYCDSIIRNMFEEAVNTDVMSQHIVNIKVLELCYLIIRRHVSDKENMKSDFFWETENKENIKAVQPIMNYIEENICSAINVCDLARLMNFSESYFSTWFKEITGCPPVKYINIRKCQKAKELMFYTNMNITAIADYLGFESVHYFSRVFKKITGISPKNYLNRGAKDIIINVEKDNMYCTDTGYEIPIKSL